MQSFMKRPATSILRTDVSRVCREWRLCPSVEGVSLSGEQLKFDALCDARLVESCIHVEKLQEVRQIGEAVRSIDNALNLASA